jgi:hypothetical protein
MVGTHAAQAERMAQERAILLVTTHGEANEVAQRVFILEGELMAARRARDATVADQQREVIEEQCECLANELTLLSLRGSKLCMAITSAPSLAPYMRECALRRPNTPRWPWGYPCSGQRCLATQSILGRLPIDGSQVAVVEEMVARFRERAEW